MSSLGPDRANTHSFLNDPANCKPSRTNNSVRNCTGLIRATRLSVGDPIPHSSPFLVKQSSSKQLQFISLLCFRSGLQSAKESSVPKEFQRKRTSNRCGCQFVIKLRLIPDTESYRISEIRNEHNHPPLDHDEAAMLSQKRFIPEEVEQKMLELNRLGVLTCSQIMVLIENEHFPDVKRTWTTRDVQNLFQSSSNRAQEAHEFVKLLSDKTAEGWQTRMKFNDNTLRLERILWLSQSGREKFQLFNDVLEMDATYKTNRFGMPLILFTTIDNNGLTILVGGCLVSDETFESYAWCIRELRECARIDPKVVFTDGDHELAKAIRDVWPNSVHLLCRFHIVQNITRNLAGILRANLNSFLDDFWRIASIEEMEDYIAEFKTMETKWTEAAHYLNILKSKQTKWAFAFTHSNFVAGVSSAQRQEMMNHQVKASLLSNSSLARIIEGFVAVDKSTAIKILQASLDTKLLAYTSDPIVEDAMGSLTSYAAKLLKQESSASLSYICLSSSPDPEGPTSYEICHKDVQHKTRTVKFDKNCPSEVFCTCRKVIWHGIVCRHIICTFRQANFLGCPMELINSRWRRDFTITGCLPTVVEAAFGPQLTLTPIRSTEAERVSELTALAKSIIVRSMSNETTYNLTKSTMQALYENIKVSMHLHQQSGECDHAEVLNPLKVKTKGRPKIGGNRCKSRSEKQQPNRKKSSG